MTDASPTPWTYEGAGMFRAPSPFFAKRADMRFVKGERYQLVEHHDKSINSHRQYFASLHEAWSQLPEGISLDFPTSEHLRKRALIACGYRDERSIVCASKAEAIRFATFCKPLDDFAAVSVHECAVVVWTAKSQSMKAMGRKTFQESKSAVLEYVWNLVGVDVETGNANAGKAA